VWKSLGSKQPLGYVVAVVVIAATTATLKVFGGHISPTTAALACYLKTGIIVTNVPYHPGK